MNGTRAERLRAALAERFATARVAVTDDSARHAGHAGNSGAGETHFTVEVVSPAFAGLSRVARQREAHAAVAAEFAGGLHALSLVLRTPDEQAAAPVGGSA